MPDPAPPTNAVGDEDPLSPTVMIHRYLAAQGLQPTAQNVHNVTMANAMGMPVIPQMVNNEPPTMPDAVAMTRRGTGGAAINPSMVNLGQGPTNEAVGGPDNTSAQPPSGGGGLSLGQIITGGLLGASVPAAIVGAKMYRNMRGEGRVPAAPPGSGTIVDPNAPPGERYNAEGRDPLQAPEPKLWEAEGRDPLQRPPAPTAPRPAEVPAAPPVAVARPSDADVLAAIRPPGLPPGVTQQDIANSILKSNPALLQPPNIGDSPIPPREGRVSIEQLPPAARGRLSRPGALRFVR